jgi:hypothetical protein
MPVPTYPPKQCPSCGLWFRPRAVNAVYCTQACGNKIKRLRMKTAEAEYLQPPVGVQPAKPFTQPAELAKLTPEFPQVAAGPTAEEALARLGYSSRPPEPPKGSIEAEPASPDAQWLGHVGPPAGGAVPAVGPLDRLECGHRAIPGAPRCPLCYPPSLFEEPPL